MAGHASELLTVAAAELEVEGSSLGSMAIRLEKLIIMQERSKSGFSDDWPDEYKIRIDKEESHIKSAEDTFIKYINIHPELQIQWKTSKYYYDKIEKEIEWGKATLSTFHGFSEKSRLLMKCAAITRAKLQAQIRAPRRRGP